jgi:integrase/recombinase XerD
MEQTIDKAAARRRKRKLRAKRSEAIQTAGVDENALMVYVKLYIDWLQVTGRTEQTVRGRLGRLARFVDWCDMRGLSQPEDLTRAVLEAYQRHLYLYRKTDGKPLSIRTQETMLTPLRGFCRWLARERYVQYNAASELVLPRAPKLLPKVVLSLVQVERVMAQPDVSGLTGGGATGRCSKCCTARGCDAWS